MEYELDKCYVDRGGSSYPDDEFLRWINIDKSGMRNSPGIRPLNYVHRISKERLPAYLILVTHDKSSSAALNPWEDIVDLLNAQILYWGDSKVHDHKRLDDFQGNAVLRRIYDYMLEGGREAIPPILHFSKPKVGIVKFNGLCVLDQLDISWFDDGGHPVRNYHARLSVLDCEKVSVAWLHHRAESTGIKDVDRHPDCPGVWKRFKCGQKTPIDIRASAIRPRLSQLPPEGSPDANVLEQLVGLDPWDFEKVIVAMFRQVKEVTHHIDGTRRTADGGFDFVGTFVLQRPLNYEIHFLGEVKRYSRTTAVSPRDVSRLVARLGRKDYGIFVTTSFFTDHAQREVIADAYPVHLVSGVDLVNMLRYLRIASDAGIRADWLDSVLTTAPPTLTLVPKGGEAG
jgi:Restriction endonuclease AspBHI N-terminal/Restriction endonuclease